MEVLVEVDGQGLVEDKELAVQVFQDKAQMVQQVYPLLLVLVAVAVLLLKQAVYEDEVMAVMD
jgi:hypothetical protein